MVIEGYFELNSDSYYQSKIKEHLGHKLIGVEPDLVFDFTMSIPRVFIRTELIAIFEESREKFVHAAYVNSKQAYHNFLAIIEDNFSVENIEDKTISKNIFFYNQSLFISFDLINKINDCKNIIDIEYRV
ncbi:hypothetical protein ACK1CN_02705 [Vibrio coralliilyticus]|uniref:hypothetical protein n=1 Tax=Vibrio TaxID=662 RepID=UPI000810A1D5|nr:MULTISPECIES: hypothetical protein [Vibrio]ANW23413.1 hypothetical protein BA953_03865 [Vibrio coralliilyticus]MCM5510621.1 hypothetical protein [Vibrio sp. SCSIO 43169]NRF61581.1 hypothetical protein [Vibrio coralliilyticus]